MKLREVIEARLSDYNLSMTVTAACEIDTTEFDVFYGAMLRTLLDYDAALESIAADHISLAEIEPLGAIVVNDTTIAREARAKALETLSNETNQESER